MDASHFDRIAKMWAAPSARRGIVRLLLIVPGLALLTAPVAESSGASRRRRTLHERRAARRDQLQEQRKKKKKKKCAKAGQATSKQRKKCCRGLTKDASGRCTTCTLAACDPTVCGSVPDGCGGTLTCGCAANQLCRDGVCQACTVTCPSGDPVACGTALQTALNAGGSVFVCPGRYQGGFTLSTAANVIGAGEGADPASNTILDGNGGSRVLRIEAGAGLVALERLRLTGGASDAGSGILHQGSTLRMAECTVSGNTVAGDGGGIFVDLSRVLEMLRCTVRDNHATGSFVGGGIYTDGITTLTDCLVEDNSADGGGGGLFVSSGLTTLAGTTQVRGNQAPEGGGIYVSATLAIAETCRVTENTAAAVGDGGGIFNSGGTVTLAGADPISPIVVNNCHENCVGTVPGCAVEPDPC